MFDSFVFLPLPTRAYFKGRAYIKIILKNHARSYFAGRSYFVGRSYFAGRSYYRGNTVVLDMLCWYSFWLFFRQEDNGDL